MSEKSLHLDPGPGRRRRSSLCSCKCLCWTISIPLLGFLGWFIFLFCTAFLRGLRFPHQSLYYTGGPPYNSSEVIRPLVPQEQTFDIAVTVWLRAPELEEAEFRRLQLENVPPKEEEPPSPVQLDIKGLGKISASVILGEVDDQDILETPLFSDIVLRGLHLSDKHRSANVAFRLPTARFLSANLTGSDLRATFLLFPSSPSLIDHVKNFSSWMPDSVLVKRPATRPWPFPLGSQLLDEKTMADLALESFSLSVPLIEFHDVASQCKNTSINDTDAACDDCEEAEAPVFKGHPHVVTRTQLRITQETTLFNATAYNAKRDQLKKQSCGQGIPELGLKPNLKMCRSNYETTGPFETLIELEVPTEHGVETQWAYAPYLSTKNRAAGPLDIIPVPVNRENCSTPRQDPRNVSDYMDIGLQIAFAGRSPMKQTLADAFTPPSLLNHSASEITKANQQNQAELWNAVFGHRFHENSHPRRRIFMQTIGGGLQFLAALMMFHYWWTRVSTAGISSSSVVLLALGYSLGGIVEAIDQSDASWQVMVFVPMFLTPPLLMLRCITRIEFGWNKWHPTLTRAPANHQERTTQRVDSRTSWGVRLAFFAALLAAHQLFNFDNIILVASSMPDPRPGEFAEKKVVNFLQTVARCLCDTGTLSQALLNHRSGAFGGSYRAEPIMHAFGFYIKLIFYYVPLVVGRMELRLGLGLKPVIDVCTQLPLVWQAFTLPPVEVRDDEED
ncbi:hypothetical protein C8F04DRAFT_222460 [Mycena alexandri]|uniref:Uncharacterized protein n=1 Tax=Mycena alexandri TaxID=1745969 RepID=A0AAD6TKF0_9AGAR|nr:hypothetical protein C8F04DRAFT_222460 [Mycena alexandri]